MLLREERQTRWNEERDLVSPPLPELDPVDEFDLLDTTYSTLC
jgi:hypothetical protein